MSDSDDLVAFLRGYRAGTVRGVRWTDLEEPARDRDGPAPQGHGVELGEPALDWAGVAASRGMLCSLDAELKAFLRGRRPEAVEDVLWPNGLDFMFSSHLTQAPPPESLVTSVRAVAHCDGLILAFADRFGSHVVPGGHREERESFTDTLRRELREETGCRLEGDDALQLGVLQMHLRSPRPENHRYPYPDALHVIYLAAVSRPQELQSSDDWVRDPRLVSADEALALPLSRTERVFLDAALAQLGR